MYKRSCFTNKVLTPFPKRGKPNDLEFSENILAILANYLWLTDWLQFMFVSRTSYQYFSQNSALWAQYELDATFCPHHASFRKLSTKEQCVALEALRKSPSPEKFMERLMKLDSSVASACILRYASHFDNLVESVDADFQHQTDGTIHSDHVLQVGIAYDVRHSTHFWPVVIRRYRLLRPTKMIQIVGNERRDLGVCMREWMSVSNFIAELRMDLIALPFSKKPEPLAVS